MKKKYKTYIIAEIGNNHNGKYLIAKKSILAAAKAGASAVKFQSYSSKEFMSNKNLIYKYKTSKGYKKEKMYEMFCRLEFNKNWYPSLFQLCKKLKIDFLSSAADIEQIKILKKIGCKTIKLASEDIINYPLLKYLSKINIKVILSTGMADEGEIKTALQILKKQKVYLLHCVSLYPTEEKNLNLNRMLKLKKFNVPVGFSDHSLGVRAPLAAVAMGANIIEKHFTLSKKLIGPDHLISMDPKNFQNLVNLVREYEAMLGDGNIMPGKKEYSMRNKFRRSIVATKKIKKGDKIIKSMLSLKRPGTGLHPKYLDKIVGKVAKRTFYKNMQIK